MKAMIIREHGGPEVLQLAERPKPVPRPGEVLIKVYAAGVNRPDVAQRKGSYPPPAGAPVDIPGLEVAGVVEAIGPGVLLWQAGDEVCALVAGGGYAEYCLAPEGQCLPVPAGVSMVEAASLPETFFTVWSNVFDRAGLKPRHSLLVHGGSSGIGVAAIQIAKALGSTVYVTAGSAHKCEVCEHLGAAKAINYKTQNFADEIMQLTNGNGVDVILDMIGGDYTPLNLAALANDGRLVLINTMKGKDAQVDLSLIMLKRITITGSTLRARDIEFKAAIAKQLKNHVWPLIEQGKIKAVINQTYALQQAAEAHLLMESSEHIGKIVLVVP
ncbi:NAD(P)H-quinone oxidoreductase [Mucilaginibacter aquatilis]|uniref:Zinc-binding dehydrogenase n=1 Tax=Mucilaginibacter aquatilis TaxID=1517760 RepID=A0A6I4I4X3_9SPHI|nr:NAD(P)H-quinone oxidoreductase [Mucilaginibacter aquatilis]MVN90130.1 zinc-binding dehydrogenase [Mucilaginibacter aquatilis]